MKYSTGPYGQPEGDKVSGTALLENWAGMLCVKRHCHEISYAWQFVLQCTRSRLGFFMDDVEETA